MSTTLLEQPTDKMRAMISHVEPEAIQLLEKCRDMGLEISEVCLFVERFDEPYVPQHELEAAKGRIKITPVAFAAIQGNVAEATAKGMSVHPNTVALIDLYGKEPNDLAISIQNQGRLFLGFAKRSFGADIERLWPTPSPEQQLESERQLQVAMRFFLLPASDRAARVHGGELPRDLDVVNLVRRSFLSQTPATEAEAIASAEGSVFVPDGTGGFFRLEVTDEGRTFALKAI